MKNVKMSSRETGVKQLDVESGDEYEYVRPLVVNSRTRQAYEGRYEDELPEEDCNHPKKAFQTLLETLSLFAW